MYAGDEFYGDDITSGVADERQTHEHDWDGGYPWRQCLECGEEEEAPEPDYDDPEDEL